LNKSINDELILTGIDHGLEGIGNSPKQALWYCLERDHNLSRQRIPENLEVFEKVMKNFFGLGYGFLDSLFRIYLSEATGENLKGYQSFSECVSYLRSMTNLEFRR
jgi:hypothetical protein